MGFQDDIFDIMHFVKGTSHEETLDRILLEFQDAETQFHRANAVVNSFCLFMSELQAYKKED